SCSDGLRRPRTFQPVLALYRHRGSACLSWIRTEIRLGRLAAGYFGNFAVLSALPSHGEAPQLEVSFGIGSYLHAFGLAVDHRGYLHGHGTGCLSPRRTAVGSGGRRRGGSD